MSYPSKSGAEKNYYYLRNYGIFFGFVIAGLIIWGFKLNQPLFYFINGLHIILPTSVWMTLNLLAYPKACILPILLIIITFIWRKDKLRNVVILILAYYAVFWTLKTISGEFRPYIVLPQGSFFWINKFENAITSAHRSFPSGHTGVMTIFVFAISSMFNKKWLNIVLFLLLVLTGLARICTGWHWPLDVIASGLIAYVLVKICLRESIKK